MKHLLYVEVKKGGKPGPLWCSCRECFRDDLAAAAQHLRTATALGEKAVPEPDTIMLAVARGNTQARGWLKQALKRCQGMLDNVPDRTYINMSFLRDELNHAALVLEDPEAGMVLADKNPAIPHTTPVTTFCLRCGHGHTVEEAENLNEGRGE